jgi:hypothetical protein
MKTFDEQIREVQGERQRAEYWETQKRIARGENIYAWYCAWCNAYNDGKGKTDGATFDRYCDEQGVAIDFGSARRLAKRILANAMSGRAKSGWWRNDSTKSYRRKCGIVRH